MNAIEIENLSVGYGENIALKNINLKIKEGEYNLIIGPNGSGKTTLLKSILGQIPINEGQIKIFDKKNHLNNHQISYVPQVNVADRNFPINVWKFVLSGTMDSKSVIPFHKFSQDNIESAEEALSLTGMTSFKERYLNELSGGEYAKILIARALAGQAKLLLLDEPTAYVDPKSRKEINILLAKLKVNHTLLVITHDLMAVDENVDSIICLNGELVYHGKPELTQEIVDKMYNCHVDLIAHGVAHRVLRRH